MHDLLQRVFEDLEQENIRYCLIRDCDRLDQLADDGDVDLLVQDTQLMQLCSQLARLGFVRLPSRGHEPHHFFVAYDKASDRWIKLDVVTEVAYGAPVHALCTTLAVGCLDNRRRSGPTYVPSPEDELVTLLLHCVLDKGHFAPNRSRRLQALCHEVTDESYISELLAEYWSPDMTWSDLASLIEAGEWEALLAEHSAVAARLAGSDRFGTLVRKVRGRVLRKLDRWAGLVRPRALAVALLAPDGAGKSTLAAGIENSFYFPVRSVYMGLYQKNGSTREVQSRIPGLGLARRLLTQWRRYLTARYHQSRGELVVFDRYTYDSLLPSRRHLDWLRRLRRWLLAHACPGPDLVLMLDAPGEVLHTRSGEHSAASLERQRRSYLKLQSRLPQTVVVDATHDVEQVRREAIHLIWRGYARRLGKNGLVGE